MIVLDTNVLSEFAKPVPHPRVMAWFEAIDADQLRISAVTVAEMLTGANRMAEGRRSDEKAELILEIIAGFHARTLSFGPLEASECATIMALRASAGRSIALADAMIAGTALAAEADAIATRDTDFADVGLPVVNPWAA